MCRKPVHGRRISRWLPKVQQLRSLGYLVVTIPPEDRGQFRTKGELARAGKAATAIVRQTWARGLRRWHWFGSKSQVYHPHLNYLVDGGPVKKKKLKLLRQALAMAMGLSRAPVINYSYTRKPGQMWHHLNYVTRATFLELAWDPELAEALHRFRNVSWWGSWDGPAAWSLDDLGGQVKGQDELSPGELAAVGKLEEGRCPIDGTKVTWRKAIAIEHLPKDLGDLGGGYWLNLVTCCGPPGT
ncbi:MAG: hypothetical protein Q8O76_05695 [Chloroflexota bacterium]|nr:hypothetical protein [Chloroflexota bacterium]